MGRLGFLGLSPFRRKSPDFKPWIFLDFLGFSRPNLDFSMGYEDKSAKDFSSRSPVRRQGRRPRSCGSGKRSCEKLNLVSDSQQEIVVTFLWPESETPLVILCNRDRWKYVRTGPCWRRRGMT